MALTFRYGSGRSLFQALVALAAAPLGAMLALRTYDPVTEIGAWAATALATFSFVVLLRQALDARAALEIRAEGVYTPRWRDTVPWDEIDALWIRRTRRRVFFVIPANSAELILQIKPEASFWRERGLLRRVQRLFAGAAGRWETAVSLNGMPRRALRRLEDALKATQPDLVQASELRTEPQTRRGKTEKSTG